MMTLVAVQAKMRMAIGIAMTARRTVEMTCLTAQLVMRAVRRRPMTTMTTSERFKFAVLPRCLRVQVRNCVCSGMLAS